MIRAYINVWLNELEQPIVSAVSRLAYVATIAAIAKCCCVAFAVSTNNPIVLGSCVLLAMVNHYGLAGFLLGFLRV